MPMFLEIARLDHIVMLVAHGTISDEEVRKVVQELIDADVASYGKIIDTSAATSNLTQEQVAEVARMLRAAPGHDARGPVAYVIDANRVGFAHRFAEASRADRPIKLFTSLREARQWVAQMMAEAKTRPAGIAAAEEIADDRSHLRKIERR